MDPWNINVSTLANRFAEEIKKKDGINLRISGKFILAASILLKMKSDFLLPVEKEIIEDGVNLSWLFKNINYNVGPQELIPRIPMKKKRRVTLDELIDALKKAIEVKERRVKRREENRHVMIPLKPRISLTEKINEVYSRISDFFTKLKKKEILFSELLPSNNRFDVIWTFMPLMHLSTKGKVLLEQEKMFGDILVKKP
jgi:segregation and condensation protein A